MIATVSLAVLISSIFACRQSCPCQQTMNPQRRGTTVGARLRCEQTCHAWCHAQLCLYAREPIQRLARTARCTVRGKNSAALQDGLKNVVKRRGRPSRSCCKEWRWHRRHHPPSATTNLFALSLQSVCGCGTKRIIHMPAMRPSYAHRHSNISSSPSSRSRSRSNVVRAINPRNPVRSDHR